MLACRRGVAQLGRALGSGPRGRWFESSRPDHFSSIVLRFETTCHDSRRPDTTGRRHIVVAGYPLCAATRGASWARTGKWQRDLAARPRVHRARMGGMNKDRYVRHRAKPEWGVGRVIDANADTTRVEFRHGVVTLKTAIASPQLDDATLDDYAAGRTTAPRGACGATTGRTVPCITCGEPLNRSQRSADKAWKSCPECSVEQDGSTSSCHTPKPSGRQRIVRPPPIRVARRAIARRVANAGPPQQRKALQSDGRPMKSAG